jgi:hypothetical protein
VQTAAVVMRRGSAAPACGKPTVASVKRNELRIARYLD